LSFIILAGDERVDKLNGDNHPFPTGSILLSLCVCVLNSSPDLSLVCLSCVFAAWQMEENKEKNEPHNFWKKSKRTENLVAHSNRHSHRKTEGDISRNVTRRREMDRERKKETVAYVVIDRTV
jgi:flagellar biosynthesis component FlhA